MIGLTATPHAKTPEDQIVFRYPLAAAIADKLVNWARQIDVDEGKAAGPFPVTSATSCAACVVSCGW